MKKSLNELLLNKVEIVATESTKAIQERYNEQMGVTMQNDLIANLSKFTDKVVVTVKESNVGNDVVNTVRAQQEQVKACVNELIARGEASKVGVFIKRAYDMLKDMLSKLVGHVKDLWNKIVAMFNSDVPVVAVA